MAAPAVLLGGGGSWLARPPRLLIVQGLQLAGPVSLREFGLTGAASVRADSLSVPLPVQTGVPPYEAAPLSLQAGLDLSPPGQGLSQVGTVHLDLPLQVLELPFPHAGLVPAPQGRQHQAGGGQRGDRTPVDVEAHGWRGGEPPEVFQAEASQSEPGTAHHAWPSAHRGGVGAETVAVEGLQVKVHAFLFGLVGWRGGAGLHGCGGSVGRRRGRQGRRRMLLPVEGAVLGDAGGGANGREKPQP